MSMPEVSRRAVLSAAWSAPLVATLVAVPASANSRPETGFACLGDSLTEDGGFGEVVADALGWRHSNLGVSGQTSTEIAFRFGALPLAVTVAGERMPGRGSVGIDSVDPATSYRAGGSTSKPFRYAAVLAGIPGTFIEDASRDPAQLSFARKDDGDAVAVPDGTLLRGTQGDSYRSDPITIWVGRNNIDNGADVLRDIDVIVASLDRKNSRFLIFSVTNSQHEPSGSTGYEQIAAINAAVEAKYPNNYLDVRRYLIDHGLAQAGLVPTADDLAAIAEDRVPPQLHRDVIHFTDTAQQVIGHYATVVMLAKRWNLR